MNQDRDNRLPSGENDPLVSAEYRAVATERTPAKLDAKVLEIARAEAMNTGLRRFMAIWFRPVAFVATLGLSLALFLELTGTLQQRPPEAPPTAVGHRVTEPFELEPNPQAQPAASDIGEERDAPARKGQAAEPPTPAGGRQRSEDSPSRPANTDDRASADFAEMMEASSKQIREADSITKAAIRDLEPSIEEVAGSRASAAAADVHTSACPENDKTDPSKWWKCIAELEKAGRHHEASIEVDLLREAYPDFDPPEILRAQ